MTIGGVAVGPFCKRVARDILDANIPGFAAQTAYYFFFSIFPLFLFVTPLLSLLGGRRRATVGVVLDHVAEIVPADAYHLIAGVVNAVVFANGAPGVTMLGAILALWAGSSVFSSLTDALDRVFGTKGTRPWW